MQRNYFEAIIRAFIMLGFSVLLFKLIHTGEIYYFVHPRFVTLLKITSLLLFIMALVQFTMTLPRPSGSGYLVYGVFALPLLMGFLLPAQSLDSYMARQKGLDLSSPAQVETGAPQTYADEEVWNPVISDENFLATVFLIYVMPEDYVDREIEVEGFVYREDDLGENRFVAARYAINCCAADATVTGFLCRYDRAGEFDAGDWVRVRGVIKMEKYNDQDLPVIAIDEMTEIAAPDNPYVY